MMLIRVSPGSGYEWRDGEPVPPVLLEPDRAAILTVNGRELDLIVNAMRGSGPVPMPSLADLAGMAGVHSGDELARLKPGAAGLALIVVGMVLGVETDHDGDINRVTVYPDAWRRLLATAQNAHDALMHEVRA